MSRSTSSALRKTTDLQTIRDKGGPMITGDLKTKIDAVWNDFRSGGISNPLEVMEQLTLLLFVKGLDEAQTRRRPRLR